MKCNGCGVNLGVIRFPNIEGDQGASTAMARCLFCGWRSTWLEGKVKRKLPPAPARKRAKDAVVETEPLTEMGL